MIQYEKYLNHAFSMGIDIVNVSRFKKKSLNNNLDFYKKIFSDSEINYCKKFSSPYEHFAGKFAIKESVIKAILDKIPLKNICVSNSKNRTRVMDLYRDIYNKFYNTQLSL